MEERDTVVEEKKKKHTLRNVILILLALFLLFPQRPQLVVTGGITNISVENRSVGLSLGTADLNVTIPYGQYEYGSKVYGGGYYGQSGN